MRRVRGEIPEHGGYVREVRVGETMSEEEVTTGEVAANILGAKNIHGLVCIYIDDKECVTYYRIGSIYESIGMLRCLLMTLENRTSEGDDLEGEEK